MARRSAASAVAPSGSSNPLASVLAAVAAATNAPGVPPAAGADERVLVGWTIEAISNMRKGALDDLHNTLQAGRGHLDPEHVGACMELIVKLNSALGGIPPCA